MSKGKKIPDNQITFYQTPDGRVNIEVLYADENIWLSPKKMAELFDVDRSVISKHLEAFPDVPIVQSMIAQLTWTHLIELISIKDPLKRDFYLTMCINERWSVRILKERIADMIYYVWE